MKKLKEYIFSGCNCEAPVEKYERTARKTWNLQDTYNLWTETKYVCSKCKKELKLKDEKTTNKSS